MLCYIGRDAFEEERYEKYFFFPWFAIFVTAFYYTDSVTTPHNQSYLIMGKQEKGLQSSDG